MNTHTLRTLRTAAAALLIAGGLGLTGCSGDPNNSGIFFDESKAKERLRRQERERDDETRETARVTGQTAGLRQQRDVLAKDITALQGELNRMNRDIANLRQQNPQRAAELDRRRTGLLDQLAANRPPPAGPVGGNPEDSADLAAKQQKVNELRTEIARLQDDIKAMNDLSRPPG
jgi:peptidoglycan hydrolase CwlO-like protein